MKKLRLLALLAAFCMLVSLFAACNGETSADETVESNETDAATDAETQSESDAATETETQGPPEKDSTSFAGGLKFTSNGDGTCSVIGWTGWAGGPSSVNIPERSPVGDLVTDIGVSAFSSNDALSSITIPSSIKSISKYAFLGCEKLTEITLPENLESIGNRAFDNCNGLTGIYIPASVKSIGDGAFYRCEKLEGIEVAPENENYCSIDGNLYDKDVTVLIKYARAKTDTSFTVPAGVKHIADEAFSSQTNLQSIAFPSSLESIGVESLGFCPDLTTVTFEEGCRLSSIGDYAFMSSTALTNISFPDGVTSIGYSAFNGCNGLIDVSLPENLETIDDKAFSWCENLKSIYIPANVESIGEEVFYRCQKLESIEVAPENENYSSIDGNLYSNSSTVLVQYAAAKTDKSFTVPAGVTHIGKYAFLLCANLESVTFPSSLKNIGAEAFDSCDALTTVTFEENSQLKSIGYRAFAYCDNLATVNYSGSYAQWRMVTLGSDWIRKSEDATVECTLVYDYKPEDQ